MVATADLVRQVVTFLRREVPLLQAIYLYGSRADGTATLNSDVDVAIVGKTELRDYDLYAAKEKLGIAIGIDVDLIDLRRVGIVLQHEAIRHRYCLWQEVGFDQDEFETKIIREYFDYRLDMLPTYKDIKETGVIYG